MDIKHITSEKQSAIISDRFPLAGKYDPIWQLENEMGSPCLWLTEAIIANFFGTPSSISFRTLVLGCRHIFQ